MEKGKQQKQSLQRLPYGDPILYRSPKKLFPEVNIHYNYHDAVLPSKEYQQLQEQYDSRNKSNVQNFYNSEDQNHYSSEYKIKYHLLGSPDVKERVRYYAPGESAGKKTFKQKLLNRAIENHQHTQDQKSNSRKISGDSGSENPEQYSIRDHQQIFAQKRNSEVSQSFTQIPKKYSEESNYIKIIHQKDFQNPQQSENPKKSITTARSPNNNSTQTTSTIDKIPADEKQQTSLPYQVQQPKSLERTMIQRDLPLIRGSLQKNKSLSRVSDNYNNHIYNSFANNVAHERIGYEKQKSFSKIGDTDISLDQKDIKLLTDEQERYISRLRKSIQKQGQIYQQQNQKIFIPQKIASLYKIEENIQTHNNNNFHLTRNQYMDASRAYLNKSMDRYTHYNNKNLLPNTSKIFL